MKIFDIDRICVFNIHYENYPLEYFLDCQQALGVKNVELLGGHPGLWMDYTDYQDPQKRKMDVPVPAYGLSSADFYRKYMYVTVSDHSFRKEPALTILKRCFGMT